MLALGVNKGQSKKKRGEEEGKKEKREGGQEARSAGSWRLPVVALDCFKMGQG